MRMRVAALGVVVIALVVVVWATGGARQKQADRAPVSQAQVSPAQASQVAVLKVEGMFCAGCEAAVKMAANKVDGVRDAQVSSETGTAEITYDPSKTSPEAIASAISDNTGFKAEAVEQSRKL